MTAFTDPATVENYAERTARIVPGLYDLHKMAGVLLAEKAADQACILVVGAGGGLELKAFSDYQPDWHFVGVDPSAEMLDQARQLLTPAIQRITFHQGYTDSAPEGPFDGATCLLTLHFLPAAERLATLKAIRHRLKPGAPLVVAHYSFVNNDQEAERWLGHNAAFSVASGVAAESARNSISAIRQRLPILSPEQDTGLLHEAGFTDIELFYSAFSFKGWVAYAL